MDAVDPRNASTSSSLELETRDRGAQLTRALHSVDTALEKLEERGEVTGLHRLREDLCAALQHAAVAA